MHLERSFAWPVCRSGWFGQGLCRPGRLPQLGWASFPVRQAIPHHVHVPIDRHRKHVADEQQDEP